MSDLRFIGPSLDGYRKTLLSEAFFIAKKKGYEITDEGMLSDWLMENGYDSLGQALTKSRNFLGKLDECWGGHIQSIQTTNPDYLEKLNESRYNRKNGIRI